MITSVVSGGIYKLTAPSGRWIDAGTGTTNAKTIKFEYGGQSMHIIWNDVAQYYILVNGGGCIE